MNKTKQRHYPGEPNPRKPCTHPHQPSHVMISTGEPTHFHHNGWWGGRSPPSSVVRGRDLSYEQVARQSSIVIRYGQRISGHDEPSGTTHAVYWPRARTGGDRAAAS